MMRNKAKALLRENRLAEAEAIYTRMLKEKSPNALVLQDVITFHNRYSSKFRAALPLIDALLKLKPKAALSHQLAAETLCNCARPFLAHPHAQEALRLAPDDPDALFIAGVVGMQLHHSGQALAHFEAALEINPTHAPTLVQKARALRDFGRFDEARAIATSLLTEDTNDQNALELYFQTTQITAEDPVWSEFQDLPEKPPKGGQMVLRQHLLAKGYADLGQDLKAFEAYATAKKHRETRYDGAAYAQFVSTQCGRVKAELYEGADANPSRQPLLIVGMPRSGSSLLEKFLIGHSQIRTAGESPSLHVIVQDIGVGKHDGALLAKATTDIPQDAIARFSQRYLSEVGHARQTSHVIDKTMHNYEMLGFFARLFPNAPIIHMTRDPLDTCVSCYMQPLSAWHSYTQDLTQLGRHYLQYQRLMEHWAATLPNPMMTLRYEDLVQNTEATLRSVVQFVDLPWEAKVGDHLSHQEATRTLSFGQVTQPIYHSSIGRWRRYGDRIDPLKEALRPLYPNGFNPADA